MRSQTFIFDAPAHHRLLLDPSKPEEAIHGGDEVTVSDKRAKELLAQHIPLKPTSLGTLKREELEVVAETAGVEGPESFGNKSELIDAIESTETDPHSEVN